MAFDPTVFSYTLQDSLGTKTAVAIYIDYTGITLINAITTAWTTVGGFIDAMTGAQILGGHIKIPLDASGSWKTSPAANSRLTNGENTNFESQDSNKSWGIFIPAFLSSLVVNGKPNTTSGALSNWINEVLTPTAVAGYTNPVGQVLKTFADAFLADRTHRRQLQRSSRTVTP